MPKRESPGPGDTKPGKAPEPPKQADEARPPQQKGSVQFNPFYRTKVFPDAPTIFSFLPKPLEDIKQDCLVVIDTNALLLPYKAGKAGLDVIVLVHGSDQLPFPY